MCTISYCVADFNDISIFLVFFFLSLLRPFSFSDQGFTFWLLFGASECQHCYSCNGVTTYLKTVDVLWYHQSWCESRDRKAGIWMQRRQAALRDDSPPGRLWARQQEIFISSWKHMQMKAGESLHLIFSHCASPVQLKLWEVKPWRRERFSM